jgi:hypothetical protein
MGYIHLTIETNKNDVDELHALGEEIASLISGSSAMSADTTVYVDDVIVDHDDLDDDEV